MAESANGASATTTVQQQQNGTAGTPEAQVGGESAQATATPAVLTLRLRPRPSVTWGADVINNEGMGKKSSKRECGGGGRRKQFQRTFEQKTNRSGAPFSCNNCPL